MTNTVQTTLLLLATTVVVAPVGQCDARTLRGFGEVTPSAVTMAGLNGYRFQCQSPKRAVVFLHKLGRDMAQTATGPVRWEMLKLGELDVPVLARPGLGSFLLSAKRNTVLAITTPKTKDLANVFAAAAAHLKGARFFDASYRYPVYLDKFSHYGIGSWYPSNWGDKNTKGKPNDVDDHFAFAKRLDLALQPNAGGYLLRNLLPKIHEYGRPYHFAQWQEWSPELAMLAPEELTMPSHKFACMPHYYGQVSDGGRRLMTYHNWQFQQQRRWLVDDPLLVDQVDPNGEVGPHNQDYFWDFSEANRRNFTRYLRDVRRYTLKTLGEAWHGDPRRFRSWDDVPICMDYSLYGWQPDSIMADRPWRVHPGTWDEGLEAGYHRDHCDDTKWVRFDLPGGELVSMFWRARKKVWYRGTLTVPERWLAAKRKAGRVYLNAVIFTSARGWKNPDRVWVNGQEIAAFSHCPGYSLTGQFDVTDTLRPGRNSVALLPAHPWWGPCGAMFLTDQPWEDYPFRDTHRNARYADWREYVSWAVADMLENTYKAIRGIDPNRFIKMQAFQAKHLGVRLAARYGGYGHNTGEGGFFRPWDKRLGYARGVPGSAEFGGYIESEDGLKRWIGWFTFEGLNAFDNFHNIQQMMYERNAHLWHTYWPYIKLAPRRDIKRPDIALLWSARNNHLLPRPVPYCFDLGRGDLQFIGYSSIYLDELGIADGLAKPYKVLWDTGTWIMSPETVAGIRRFVEAGGTFVALQETGRHTPTRRDAWPISTLTGFKVRAVRPMTGSLTILREQPLLTKLAGRSFYNRGKSIDYSDYNYADKCIVLEPVASDTQPVARYRDGTIAVGMRRLGKGRVVVLGSPFWRDSYDGAGMWWPGQSQCEFLEDMLAGLGLKPLAAADTRDVWREHYLANNGTEEYLALWNPFREPRTFSVVWTTVNPAGKLYDPKNGKVVPGTVKGRHVHLEKLTLGPLETLIVATQPNKAPQTAVRDWFDQLAFWWRKSAPGTLLERPDLPVYELRLADRLRAHVTTAAEAAGMDQATLSTTGDPGARFVLGAARSPEAFEDKPDANRRCVYHVAFRTPGSWRADDTTILYVRAMTHAIGNVVGPVDAWLNGTRILEQANASARGYSSLQGGAEVDVSALLERDGDNVLVFTTGPNGFHGEVDIQMRPAPSETLAVTGTWQVQTDADNGLRPVELPGTMTGLFAATEVTVPAAWQTDRVFARIDVTDMGAFDAFAINEKVVFHPVNWFQRVTYMDITPWVRCGRVNRLTLITRAATRTWQPGKLEVRKVELQRVKARR